MDNYVYEDDSDYENDETKFTKKFRPEWLDSENTMFINKLNEICKTYTYYSDDVSEKPKL
jgi:hypothetical protein